jgi:tetratricopeptide (TPR) repeat protein
LQGRPRRGKAVHWLSGLVRRERFPTEPFYLGLFHYWRGETEAATSLFAEAIRASDGAYFEIYQNLGSALYRLGRYTDAAECYRIVLEDRPSYPVARQRLADIERRLSAPAAR